MEENANVVVKLLIRRPECFGPALRGEGGQGLLAAMKEAIKISEDPTLDLPKIIEEVSAGYESPRSLHCTVLLVLNIQYLSILIPPFSFLSCLIFFEEKRVRVAKLSDENINAICCSAGEEGGEIIHMGNAIMSFYSALIDLLGRCAPEMHVRFSMTTTKTNVLHICF